MKFLKDLEDKLKEATPEETKEWARRFQELHDKHICNAVEKSDDTALKAQCQKIRAMLGLSAK